MTIDETNNEQEIVKDYFQQQENNKLTLCIYEEKAGNDIEWFHNGFEWCYLKSKKYSEKIDDERFHGTKLVIEKKRFKTFGKKCRIAEMSFDNFMAIDYMNFYNANEVDVEELHLYANRFTKLKKEKEQDGLSFTLDDYHTYMKEQAIQNEQKAKAGCRDCVLWIFTVLFFLFSFANPKLFIITMICCPLTWKLLSKIKNCRKTNE